MALLRRLRSAVLVSLALCNPAQAEQVERWTPFIKEATLRFGVPANWIKRVLQAESGGQTHLAGQPIRSPAGAMGLMQLMPGTWGEMRQRLGLGSDPDDPRDNILAGALYLRLMYDRFGYPGLFAAYNAGPARYAAHLSGRRPLPKETLDYLAAVTQPSLVGEPQAPFAARQGLFALHQPAESQQIFKQGGIHAGTIFVDMTQNGQDGVMKPTAFIQRKVSGVGATEPAFSTCAISPG